MSPEALPLGHTGAEARELIDAVASLERMRDAVREQLAMAINERALAEASKTDLAGRGADVDLDEAEQHARIVEHLARAFADLDRAVAAAPAATPPFDVADLRGKLWTGLQEKGHTTLASDDALAVLDEVLGG